MENADIDRIADELLAALAAGNQIAPLSTRYPGFSLADGYRVALRLHEARIRDGAVAVGRKIGFTNRAIWTNFGISGPIWGYVYDSTVGELADGKGRLSLAGLAEPRIEPEIVVHLAAAPKPGMDEDALLGCIDWVSHGYEIVQSIYPGWAFQVADAVAARAVHARLLLGARHAIARDRRRWSDELESFAIEMTEAGGARRTGQGRDVLGGPVHALRFLVNELERYPGSTPLAAGEIITTGTLTEAMPLKAGQTWTTALNGIALEGLQLSAQ